MNLYYKPNKKLLIMKAIFFEQYKIGELRKDLKMFRIRVSPVIFWAHMEIAHTKDGEMYILALLYNSNKK